MPTTPKQQRAHYSVIKWVGKSDYKSSIGVVSWKTVIKNAYKEKALETMNNLAEKGIRAALYKNGVNISKNYV